jgi:hypothetical protein
MKSSLQQRWFGSVVLHTNRSIESDHPGFLLNGRMKIVQPQAYDFDQLVLGNHLYSRTGKLLS